MLCAALQIAPHRHATPKTLCVMRVARTGKALVRQTTRFFSNLGYFHNGRPLILFFNTSFTILYICLFHCYFLASGMSFAVYMPLILRFCTLFVISQPRASSLPHRFLSIPFPAKRMQKTVGDLSVCSSVTSDYFATSKCAVFAMFGIVQTLIISLSSDGKVFEVFAILVVASQLTS